MAWFLLFLAAFASITSADNVNIEKRFLKCDNILAVKVCDRFRNVGATLKLKASEFEALVKDAIDKGKDVKQYIENKLEEKLLSKSCEELAGESFCKNLDVFGIYLQKKKEELKPYVVKAVLAGKQKAQEIAIQVREYVKNDLMTKKCVDILPAEHCKRIEDIGAAFKLKANEIKQVTIENVLKGLSKARDVASATLQSMKRSAEKFECEELLNPDVCVSLRKYAAKFRIGMPKMMRAVRSAIVMGYKVGKGFLTVVYKIADAFIDCEHFLSVENCRKIKDTASKIGAKLTEIRDAIKSAVTKGITEAEKIYSKTLKFLKDKFGKQKRSLIDRADLEAKLKKYRELLKKHIANADKYLKEALKMLMKKFKVADQAIRTAVEKAIAQGKLSYEEIKSYIEELMKKNENGQVISKRDTSGGIRDLLKKALSKATGITAVIIRKMLEYPMEKLQSMKRYVQGIVDSVLGTETKRDVDSQLVSKSYALTGIRDLLKKALSKATGITAVIIRKLLEYPMEKLQSIKSTVQGIIDSVLGTGDTKRDVENEMMDEAADELVKTKINDMTNDLNQQINDMAEDIVEDTAALIDEVVRKEKRSATGESDISDYIMKILKKTLGDAYDKMQDKIAKNMADVKEALKKAGTNMLDRAEAVLKKIDQILKKITEEKQS